MPGAIDGMSRLILMLEAGCEILGQRLEAGDRGWSSSWAWTYAASGASVATPIYGLLRPLNSTMSLRLEARAIAKRAPSYDQAKSAIVRPSAKCVS